jgi:hypothetical protein
LLSASVAFVFNCFFLASPLGVTSTFSLRPGACCCCFVDVLIPLVDSAGLLLSSLAATFLTVATLFDVVG